MKKVYPGNTSFILLAISNILPIFVSYLPSRTIYRVPTSIFGDDVSQV